jgi:cell division protein FtsQ
MSLGTTRRAAGTREASTEANRFRDRALSHRRRSWRRWLAWLAAAGLVALLVWVVGWSRLLGVDEVVVSGIGGAERTAVAELVQVAAGTPLARVDTDGVAQRVRTRITVAEVSVRRSWPGTLAVDVVPRTAALVVKNPQGRLEVVDPEGVSFAVVRTAPKGVPVVTATGARGMTPEALQSSLALLEALPADIAGKVTALTVSSADLVTFSLGKRTVVWGSGEESVRKVEILRALLPTKAGVIDVSAPDTPVTR